VDVEMLADDLWPEADGDMAQSAFSTTLNRLRKILVQKEVIQLYNGRLSLNPLYCWLDIWSFEEKIDEAAALMAQEDPVRAKFSYEEAVAYYEGPFLSREPQKHWMVPVRERLALKFLKALGVLGGILEAENRYDEAIRLYQQGLEADNLEETFYQRLMRCHEKLGRDADAVKVYLRCKETFHDQLRVSPAAATDEIYERIIARQHSRIDR
jgi:DNA-binding SARP family transcriptional activator